MKEKFIWKATAGSKEAGLANAVLRGLFSSSTPAERGFENGRHTVSYRAAGWLRFVPAAFLAFWLCGWAAGMAFAGGALVYGVLRMISPGTPMPFGIKVPIEAGPGPWLVIGFLALWVSLWTLGGLAALHALLELLFLRERLSFDAGGVRIERGAPWMRTREWPAGAIEGVFLRRKGGLELQSGGKRHLLLALGTPAELKALRDELRAIFGQSRTTATSRELPPEWESYLEPEGATVLCRSRGIRRRQAWVMTLVAAFCSGAVVWLVTAFEVAGGFASPEFLVPVFILLFPLWAGAAWLWLGGSQVRVRSGAIEFRRWLGAKVWSVTLRPTSLQLEHHVDTDGDDHWALEVREGPRVRRVHAAMNDLDAVRAIGSWLAAQAGLELTLPRGVELGD